MSTLRGKGKRKRPEQPEPEPEPPAPEPVSLILLRKIRCLKMLSPSQSEICERNSHLRLRYNLRNRKVFVPNTAKPELGPLEYKKGKVPVYDGSWQSPTCAKVALEHYNRSNEDEYEMVKALDSVSSFFNGVWVHVNFLAKLKGATRCPDLIPRFFFAEVKSGPDGMSCVSCVKIDPGSPEATPIRGCGICRNNEIFHPAGGGHRGDRKCVR